MTPVASPSKLGLKVGHKRRLEQQREQRHDARAHDAFLQRSSATLLQQLHLPRAAARRLRSPLRSLLGPIQSTSIHYAQRSIATSPRPRCRRAVPRAALVKFRRSGESGVLELDHDVWLCADLSFAGGGGAERCARRGAGG